MYEQGGAADRYRDGFPRGGRADRGAEGLCERDARQRAVCADRRRRDRDDAAHADPVEDGDEGLREKRSVVAKGRLYGACFLCENLYSVLCYGCSIIFRKFHIF